MKKTIQTHKTDSTQKKLFSITSKIIFTYLITQSSNIITSSTDLEFSSQTNLAEQRFKFSNLEDITWKTDPQDIVRAIIELRREAEKTNHAVQDLFYYLTAHFPTKKELVKTNKKVQEINQSLLDFIEITNESLKTIDENLQKNEEFKAFFSGMQVHQKEKKS